MLDTMRDSDSARSLPRLVRPLLDLLRSGEPAFQKDTLEYQFRRVQFEILNRLPVNEAFRNLVPAIFSCMLHIVRYDNEENGTSACKTMVDLIRSYRAVTEEGMTEFVAIFQEALQSMKDLVPQYLSEDSAPVDSNIVLPALRSFKTLAEMGMVMVVTSQFHRNLVVSTLQATTPHIFEVLALESPVQNKARTDCEAMGGIWAGMSPSIKNPSIYNDFIQAQIKVCGFFPLISILLLTPTKMLSYLAYVMRFSGDVTDSYGETLILSALRLLQDCPSHGVAMRRVNKFGL